GRRLVACEYLPARQDSGAPAGAPDRHIGIDLDYPTDDRPHEDTVVMYGSGEGVSVGGDRSFDKRFIYEQSLKTPFVIRYPGVIKPGTVVEELIANIDWAPTVLDLAGIKAPEEVQGRSFLPLLTREATPTPWRDAVYYHYYEFPQPHHVYPHFGLRTDRYKLVRFYGGADSWELYDLQNDPHELNNIYGEEHRELITSLKKR